MFLLLSIFQGCKREFSVLDQKETTANTAATKEISVAEGSGFFDKNKLIGGDVTIIDASIEGDGNLSYKIFDIDAPAGGVYFFNAWGNSPELTQGKGKFLQYEVTVNNETLTKKFDFSKSGWHNAAYVDNLKKKTSITLKEGRNRIVFSCNAPIVPAIDFIRLTKNEQNSEIADYAYADYLRNVQSTPFSAKAIASSDTTSTSNLSSSPFSTPADDPKYEYDFHLSAPFKYTFYTTVYFNSGQQVFFTTTSSSFLHVMEVFSSANPQSHSWRSVSNSGGMASLNINIPATGMYFVRVRSYWQDQDGLVNLNINGQYSYPNCVAAGAAGFRSYHVANQDLNYFTCNSTGDTRIWMEDNSGLPGRIIGYNDDYGNNGGDFYWGLNSRIKKNFNTTIGATLISSYSSYTPIGWTDLYIRCKNSNIMSYFPNLKADDAIMSSSASNIYNCTAWTGGFTRGWFWGGMYSSQSGGLIGQYYGNPQVWSTWDNYYGNNPERYIGAMTYTSVGADANNGIIAMWALNNGSITHGSIKKPGNNHAHGYDWESKPGALMRTFHPRDALSGTSYGNIVKYYQEAGSSLSYSRKAATSEGLSFEESVSRGLTVIEDVELNNSDREKIALKKQMMGNNSNEISNLYNNWIKEIKSDKYKANSNPYVLIGDTKEGVRLLDYAKNHTENTLVFFADIIFNKNREMAFEQDISYLMFCEIMKDRYGALMEDIKQEWKSNKFTSENRYKAPLPETFTKKYIKAILNKL